MKNLLIFIFCFLSFNSLAIDLEEKDFQLLKNFYNCIAIEDNKFIGENFDKYIRFSYYSYDEDKDFENFQNIFELKFYFFDRKNKIDFNLSGAFFFINFMEDINKFVPIEKYYQNNIFLASYYSDNFIYKIKFIIENDTFLNSLEEENIDFNKEQINSGLVNVVFAYKKKVF